MNHLLLVGITTTLCWLQGFDDLDDALAALRARRSIKGKVSASIARDAVEEIGEANGRRLRALATIARAGKADKALARALLERFSDKPDGDGAVLEVLAELPAAVVDPLVLRANRVTQSLSELVLLKKGKLPRAIARLYVRYEKPKDLGRQLEAWVGTSPIPQGFAVLVRELAHTQKPRELLLALLPATVPTAQEGRWVEAVSQLLFGHDEALTDAVDLLDRPDTRQEQRSRLLGAIGYEPHDHDQSHGAGHAPAHAKLRKRVVGHVTKAIKEGSGEVKARALESAQRLRLVTLLPEILRAAASQDERVQAAAISTLPDMLRATFEAESRKKKPDRKAVMGVKKKIEETVAQSVRSTRGVAQVAALLAARRLRLKKALREVVGEIAADTRAEKANRLTALRCFASVMPRDAKTVDLLLKLMAGKDRELAEGAWRAIQGVARTRLPFRMKLWRSWRARAKLK